MKQQVLLVALLSVAIGAFAQQRSDAYLRVTRQPVVLPDDNVTLMLVDGQLKLASSDLIWSAKRQGATIVALEGDTVLNAVEEDANYYVVNPATRHLFYTLPGRQGKCSLYEVVPREGKKPKNKRVSLGDVKYSIEHPVFTKDGELMVFASSDLSSETGSDLYYSRYFAGGWSQPVRFGNQINTSGDEIMPFVVDNLLVFASKGRALGDSIWTIYATELISKGDWGDTAAMYPIGLSRCYALPEPINVGNGVTSLVVDSVSNIYWIDYSDGCQHINLAQGQLYSTRFGGRVADTLNRPIEGVSVVLSLDGTEQAVAYTDENGSFELPIRPGVNYVVEYTKEGYFSTKSKAFSTMPEAHTLPVRQQWENVSLSQLPIGEPFYIENIFGDNADIELTDAACAKLAPICRFLSDNPSFRTTIILRSDLTHDNDYNTILTQVRLDAVKDFFTEHTPKSVVVQHDNDCEYGCTSATGITIMSVLIEKYQQ